MVVIIWHMSFVDVVIVTVSRDYYRIHFQEMANSHVMMQIKALSEKWRTLKTQNNRFYFQNDALETVNRHKQYNEKNKQRNTENFKRFNLDNNKRLQTIH